MGLLILLDWTRNSGARDSLMLWLLLAAAMGLTFWECRERGYRPVITLWWVTLVAITHAPGYIVLRFLVRPPKRD